MTAMLGANATSDYGSTAAYAGEMSSLAATGTSADYGGGTEVSDSGAISASGAIPEPVLLGMKLTITLLSVTANITSISILIYGKLYRKHMYLITLIITAVDLFTSALHLPVAIAVSHLGSSVNGSLICIFNAFTTSFSIDVALLSQVTYNIDRYIAIRFPYFYLNRVSRLGICVAWAVAAGTLVIVKAVRILGLSTAIVYYSTYEICVEYVRGDSILQGRLRYLFEMILNVTGYTAIFFTSLQVSRIAWQHHRRMAAQDLVSGAGVHEKDVSILASFQTVLLTSAAFVVTGLPKVILLLLPHSHLPKEMIVGLFWLVYANGIINVIIYGYKFAEFRAVCKRMLMMGRTTKVGVQPPMELATLSTPPVCCIAVQDDTPPGVNPS